MTSQIAFFNRVKYVRKSHGKFESMFKSYTIQATSKSVEFRDSKDNSILPADSIAGAPFACLVKILKYDSGTRSSLIC